MKMKMGGRVRFLDEMAKTRKKGAVEEKEIIEDVSMVTVREKEAYWRADSHIFKLV